MVRNKLCLALPARSKQELDVTITKETTTTTRLRVLVTAGRASCFRYKLFDFSFNISKRVQSIKFSHNGGYFSINLGANPRRMASNVPQGQMS